MDHLEVLKAIKEIPFGVGNKLLTDFLRGETDNYSIKKNNLDKLDSFGSLFLSKDEVKNLIKKITAKGFIKKVSLNDKKYIKVYKLTEKGKKELESPGSKSENLIKHSYNYSKISKKDEMLFEHFSFFLDDYNDFQKKAIISPKKNILAVAGAGTGKTTVLTKRIKFLKKYRLQKSDKILAITFTRKAKDEMKNRLNTSLNDNVRIETFHSFCEKILRENNDLIYKKNFSVMSYGDRIKLFNKALSHIDIDVDVAIKVYFTKRQRSYQEKDKLRNTLVNDIFFVRNYFKSKNLEITRDNLNNTEGIDGRKIDLVFRVSKFIDQKMKEKGLRNFTDQMMDTIDFFENYPEKVPHFSHILIDEFQDINSIQMNLVNILSFDNSFFVGDPRQSIFGWRGSDVNFILNFDDLFDDFEVITLKKNYRSRKKIIEFANKSIENMNLSELESTKKKKGEVIIEKKDSTNDEFKFILNKIKDEIESGTNPNEIFVLSRTNKLIKEFSKHLKSEDIRFSFNNGKSNGEGILLSTVHSIKGMESKIVFIVGCDFLNFPIKTSEHPVIDMVKVKEYDKEEEERRLLYVAITRAKEKLYITHSKNISYFINDDMIKISNKSDSNSNVSVFKIIKSLRNFRDDLSSKLNVDKREILKNTSIQDIAIKRPQKKSELIKIKGLNKTQIEEFGEEIVNLLNSMC